MSFSKQCNWNSFTLVGHAQTNVPNRGIGTNGIPRLFMCGFEAVAFGIADAAFEMLSFVSRAKAANRRRRSPIRAIPKDLRSPSVKYPKTASSIPSR